MTRQQQAVQDYGLMWFTPECNGSVFAPVSPCGIRERLVCGEESYAAHKGQMKANNTMEVGQMALWQPDALVEQGRLSKMMTVKIGLRKDTNEVMSETIKMLPASSKDGDSIKAQTGFTGAMLKAAVRENSDELKTWLVQQAAKLGGDSHFTGVSLRATKSGRVSLTFKRCEGITVERATDEELCERLGITMEQLTNIRESQKPADDTEEETTEQPELVPAPQNGKPKLVPAKPTAKPTAKPANKK